MILLSNSTLEGVTPSSFQERFKRIKRIAIIYPEEKKWIRIAEYTLRRLYDLPEPFEFLILQASQLDRNPEDQIVEIIQMVYRPRKPDRDDLIKKISKFNPDILFQLEPQPDERLIRLLMSLPVNLKIGFGPEQSGLDIVYSQNKTGFYEKNILNLIALINPGS